MSPNRDWILFLALIVTLLMAAAGAFMYPLNTMGLLNILLYELVIFTGTISILVLIYKRGIE
jgi:hypothetical protein